MKIIQLQIENVKKLSALNIRPKGDVVVVSGKNGAGKSSVLDSIIYGFGGASVVPDKPVRRGADSAEINIDLGDLKVRRTFTASGGGSLIVTNKDGVKQKSPQEILDTLYSSLTFDPLLFAKQKPKERADTLRQLANLDFSKLDEERTAVYEERTAVNRAKTQLQNRFVGYTEYEVPAEEQSTQAILEQQKAALESNKANADARRELDEARDLIEMASKFIGETQGEIDRAEQEIQRLIQAKNRYQEQIENSKRKIAEHKERSGILEKRCADLKDVDLTQFSEALKTVEETNRKIRSNKARAELVKQFKAESEKSDKLSKRLEEIESEKRKRLLDAEFPVKELTLSDDGEVMLKKIPFEQASTAEKIRCSVAMGIAMNPKLKVLLIHSGNDLDDDGIKLVAQMASKAGAQVWIERIASGEFSIVIEDGHVVSEPPTVDIIP